MAGEKVKGARKGGRAAAAAGAPALDRGAWARRLVRNLFLMLPVAGLLWYGATPFYNLFLVHSAETLVRLGESPDATHVELSHGHDGVISRSDSRVHGLPRRVRVTDIHFPLVLMIGLFLATPNVRFGRRMETLGYALLISVFFHIIDLVFWVKFFYATQLGAWSAQHYGPFAQNFWGMGKHLLDLPVKLALPLVLWCAFYLPELLGKATSETASSPAAKPATK